VNDTATVCHPEWNEGSGLKKTVAEILRGACLELNDEILRLRLRMTRDACEKGFGLRYRKTTGVIELANKEGGKS